MKRLLLQVGAGSISLWCSEAVSPVSSFPPLSHLSFIYRHPSSFHLKVSMCLVWQRGILLQKKTEKWQSDADFFKQHNLVFTSLFVCFWVHSFVDVTPHSETILHKYKKSIPALHVETICAGLCIYLHARVLIRTICLLRREDGRPIMHFNPPTVSPFIFQMINEGLKKEALDKC